MEVNAEGHDILISYRAVVAGNSETKGQRKKFFKYYFIARRGEANTRVGQFCGHKQLMDVI